MRLLLGCLPLFCVLTPLLTFLYSVHLTHKVFQKINDLSSPSESIQEGQLFFNLISRVPADGANLTERASLRGVELYGEPLLIRWISRVNGAFPMFFGRGGGRLGNWVITWPSDGGQISFLPHHSVRIL